MYISFILENVQQGGSVDHETHLTLLGAVLNLAAATALLESVLRSLLHSFTTWLQTPKRLLVVLVASRSTKLLANNVGGGDKVTHECLCTPR
jgi:hypothetical protein